MNHFWSGHSARTLCQMADDLGRKDIEREITAFYMPPLPRNRKHNHFNIGDKVVVFYNNLWYTGEVKNGYRHHDGCVSYKLDGIGPQNEGEYWGCGFGVPCVMLKSEYDWFRDNPDKYKIWRDKSCAERYNGEIIELPEVLI